jgi:hypothetical protein
MLHAMTRKFLLSRLAVPLVFLAACFAGCETTREKENRKGITIMVGGTPHAKYEAIWNFGASTGAYHGAIELDSTVILSNLPPVNGTFEIKKIGNGSTMVFDIIEDKQSKVHLGIRPGERGGRVTRKGMEWQSEIF